MQFVAHLTNHRFISEDRYYGRMHCGDRHKYKKDEYLAPEEWELPTRIRKNNSNTVRFEFLIAINIHVLFCNTFTVIYLEKKIIKKLNF